MSKPRRVLIVCLGNHCRSPAAEAILTQLGNESVECTAEVHSAGLVDKWVGKPAHPAMIEAAARRGYDLTSHRGTRVDATLLARADLILAMDTNVLTALSAIQSPASGSHQAHIELYLGDRDVADPWGQPNTVFDACVELIEAGAHRLLTTIASQPVER